MNEVIRAISSLFIYLFFLRKDFTRKKKAKKSTKMLISEQKQKSQLFYVLKKHLRRRKLLIYLFAYLCFLCSQKRQYFYAHKNI